MIRKHRTKEKRRFAVLLMAMLLASPPNLKAQSTDVYFESQGFGSGYAYGFSHEGFGNDLIYNFSHQIYGDDYIYNFCLYSSASDTVLTIKSTMSVKS